MKIRRKKISNSKFLFIIDKNDIKDKELYMNEVKPLQLEYFNKNEYVKNSNFTENNDEYLYELEFTDIENMSYPKMKTVKDLIILDYIVYKKIKTKSSIDSSKNITKSIMNFNSIDSTNLNVFERQIVKSLFLPIPQIIKKIKKIFINDDIFNNNKFKLPGLQDKLLNNNFVFTLNEIRYMLYKLIEFEYVKIDIFYYEKIIEALKSLDLYTLIKSLDKEAIYMLNWNNDIFEVLVKKDTDKKYDESKLIHLFLSFLSKYLNNKNTLLFDEIMNFGKSVMNKCVKVRKEYVMLLNVSKLIMDEYKRKDIAYEIIKYVINVKNSYSSEEYSNDNVTTYLPKIYEDILFSIFYNFRDEDIFEIIKDKLNDELLAIIKLYYTHKLENELDNIYSNPAYFYMFVMVVELLYKDSMINDQLKSNPVIKDALKLIEPKPLTYNDVTNMMNKFNNTDFVFFMINDFKKDYITSTGQRLENARYNVICPLVGKDYDSVLPIIKYNIYVLKRTNSYIKSDTSANIKGKYKLIDECILIDCNSLNDNLVYYYEFSKRNHGRNVEKEIIIPAIYRSYDNRHFPYYKKYDELDGFVYFYINNLNGNYSYSLDNEYYNTINAQNYYNVANENSIIPKTFMFNTNGLDHFKLTIDVINDIVFSDITKEINNLNNSIGQYELLKKTISDFTVFKEYEFSRYEFDLYDRSYTTYESIVKSLLNKTYIYEVFPNIIKAEASINLLLHNQSYLGIREFYKTKTMNLKYYKDYATLLNNMDKLNLFKFGRHLHDDFNNFVLLPAVIMNDSMLNMLLTDNLVKHISNIHDFINDIFNRYKLEYDLNETLYMLYMKNECEENKNELTVESNNRESEVYLEI